jgi:hypothetical protein
MGSAEAIGNRAAGDIEQAATTSAAPAAQSAIMRAVSAKTVQQRAQDYGWYTGGDDHEGEAR